jgi:hypothetical protein
MTFVKEQRHENPFVAAHLTVFSVLRRADLQ